MHEEIQALHANSTWELVLYLPNMNVVGCHWVFKTKLKSYGTLETLKAHLVAKGFNQVSGVDFGETFNPIIKPQTICFVLTIVITKKWVIQQLDVKNVFLHDFLQELVFMEQPPGFINSTTPHYVCKLQRTLYGLKQASHT